MEWKSRIETMLESRGNENNKWKFDSQEYS